MKFAGENLLKFVAKLPKGYNVTGLPLVGKGATSDVYELPKETKIKATGTEDFLEGQPGVIKFPNQTVNSSVYNNLNQMLALASKDPKNRILKTELGRTKDDIPFALQPKATLLNDVKDFKGRPLSDNRARLVANGLAGRLRKRKALGALPEGVFDENEAIETRNNIARGKDGKFVFVDPINNNYPNLFKDGYY